MCGDGTNDAPALAQADVGVAMNTGTQAAKEAGNMVDLDSDPTKLIEVVEIGKQLLMTRGALTTFSSPTTWPSTSPSCPRSSSRLSGLGALNVMGLASPAIAPILSAVIFNALIIVALIPMALHRTMPLPLRGRTSGRATRRCSRPSASAQRPCGQRTRSARPPPCRSISSRPPGAASTLTSPLRRPSIR
jgi:potassium-transporting ATPase ATP-binding subunit